MPTYLRLVEPPPVPTSDAVAARRRCRPRADCRALRTAKLPWPVLWNTWLWGLVGGALAPLVLAALLVGGPRGVERGAVLAQATFEQIEEWWLTRSCLRRALLRVCVLAPVLLFALPAGLVLLALGAVGATLGLLVAVPTGVVLLLYAAVDGEREQQSTVAEFQQDVRRLAAFGALLFSGPAFVATLAADTSRLPTLPTSATVVLAVLFSLAGAAVAAGMAPCIVRHHVERS